MPKLILSLFDYSGIWSSYYANSKNYVVIQYDIKLGNNIFDINQKTLFDFQEFLEVDGVHGILASPPCTDFTSSGAQYWKQKDLDGRTEESLRLVLKTMEIIKWAQPVWWALENPVGRLNKLVPELVPFGPWYFQPHWFGDPYTKKTGLWGTFNRNLQHTDVEAIRSCKQGSWLQKLGSKSEKTKELRSMTPKGFAKAFFDANP